MIFYTYSTVHWPRNRTLCLPIFKEDKEGRSHQENTCISYPPPQTKTSEVSRYPPESHSSQSPLPPHVDCTSHSENVPAVLTRRWDHVELPESLISDTLSQNTGGGPRSEVGEECEGEQHSSSDVSDSLFQLLLGPDSLMEEHLPKDRDSLLELRSHMAMELVWLKQAIASRQKVSHARICIAILLCNCSDKQ